MANEEHLDLLKQGVAVWNVWRREHPDIRPDLRGADLAEATLLGADLAGATLTRALFTETNLTRADLTKADLVGAKLKRTNLEGAKLVGAKLERADLPGANLTGANLQGANLERASLIGTSFTGASLERVRLLGANLDATVFASVDLSTVTGLDAINHRGPSTIGIDTIYLSRGNIPESFLRGAGVPDTFIEYMHSLVIRPIEYYSCFISYSSKDQDCAERLHNDLQNKGVRCWFAPEDLKIGDRFRDRIEESIRIYEKLLLILSEHSVASPWVEREVHAALEREDTQQCLILFPIRLDDAVLHSTKQWAAEIRRARHIGDFRRWKQHDEYQKALQRLLRDLKADAQAAGG